MAIRDPLLSRERIIVVWYDAPIIQELLFLIGYSQLEYTDLVLEHIRNLI